MPVAPYAGGVQLGDTPLWARIHLAHATLQAAADDAGVDVLHIKGPTLDPMLRPGPHSSTDADVLVRPAHLDRFLATIAARGWVEFTGFDEGSPFGHAANYNHDLLAHADIHRLLPGPNATPGDVFEALWRDRTVKTIAHRDCTTPGLAGQVFVQVLHAARSHGTEPPEAWMQADDALRQQTRALAARLDAEVALAAGLGELDAYAGAHDHDLWAYWSAPDTGRLGEWRARLSAASGPMGKLRVLGQATRVNRTHLALRLGHEPTRAELRQEQRARLHKLWREVFRR